MSNSVYSEITNLSLSASAQDTYSISMYGLMESVYSANSTITTQADLQAAVNGQLSKTAYPAIVFLLRREIQQCVLLIMVQVQV